MLITSSMSGKDWGELLQQLQAMPDITVNYFPKTKPNGDFAIYHYIDVECNGYFYQITTGGCIGYDVQVIPYQKIDPYQRKQIRYPYTLDTDSPMFAWSQLLEYLHRDHHVCLKDTPIQRIYLTELYGVHNGTTRLYKLRNELCGARERAIFKNLGHIEMTRHDDSYKVLRFWTVNKEEYFDYEVNSHRITE